MHRVLIVDDHVDNGRPLVRLFRHFGVDAWCVTNGPDGLAALAENRPDLLLLDVMMPDMDGFEVLRRIRADRQFDGLVVLMYTAALDPDTRSRAADMGAQGYVTKGTSFDVLRAEVERHLTRS